MRFMKASDGTAFNVDQIVSVGPAASIRGTRGYGPYLMVTLPDGRAIVPQYRDTTELWPANRLDEFLALIQETPVA